MTCVGGNFLPVFKQNGFDIAVCITAAEHSEFGAPLEHHLIFENAVKYSSHTVLLYQSGCQKSFEQNTRACAASPLIVMLPWATATTKSLSPLRTEANVSASASI